MTQTGIAQNVGEDECHIARGGVLSTLVKQLKDLETGTGRYFTEPRGC